MPTLAEKIADALAKRMDAELDAALLGGSTCTSTNVEAPALTPKTFAAMVAEWEKMRREFRRTDVTVVVSLAHEGPILRTRHPTDGTFFECSYSQAQAIHEHMPLILHEVIDEHTAHFKLATPYSGWFPKYLPAPPYELPPSMDDEQEATPSAPPSSEGGPAS